MRRELPLVLLLEEEREIVLLIQWAIRSEGIRALTRVASTGRDALDYLEGRPPYEDRKRHPLPSLILLTLGAPRIPELELLAHLQESAALQDIPVLVLTPSWKGEEARRAFSVGARRVVRKPVGFTEVASLVRELFPLWLEAG